MTWCACRLGDVLTLKRGHDLPDSKRQDGTVPVVSSSGVTGQHNVAKAKAPGVVTGRYGTLGEVFYIEEDYWPLNTALYVTDFKGNHPHFVAYFLQSVLRNYQSDKTAVPGVNRNVLHELRVRCPDAKSQERIVGILSAYDDLIENNRRRMALLEEAARQLYREWFVRLRFPGHEHVRIRNGVPEGGSGSGSGMSPTVSVAERHQLRLRTTGKMETSLGLRPPMSLRMPISSCSIPRRRSLKLDFRTVRRNSSRRIRS